MTKNHPSEAVESLEDSDGLLLADGFEEAFIGTAECKQCNGRVAVYDRDECLSVLMSRDGMDLQEANEFFEFNVEGAYMGERTPLFLQLNTLSEFLEFG